MSDDERRGTARLVGLVSAVYERVWITRAVTLGVRTVVIGEKGIFLVRHTYTSGWYLPGGGVDRGEHVTDAAVRELREEGGLLCLGRPSFHGLFRNGRRDHVACYVVREFEVQAERKPSFEIAETGWFSPDALPAAATRATRARLEEVLDGRPPADDW